MSNLEYEQSSFPKKKIKKKLRILIFFCETASAQKKNMLDDLLSDVFQFLNIKESLFIQSTSKKWASQIDFQYLLQRDYPIAYNICFIEKEDYYTTYRKIKETTSLQINDAICQMMEFFTREHFKPSNKECEDMLTTLKIIQEPVTFIRIAGIYGYQKNRIKCLQYYEVVVSNYFDQLKRGFGYLVFLFSESKDIANIKKCYLKGISLHDFDCFANLDPNLFSLEEYNELCDIAIQEFPCCQSEILFGKSYHSKAKKIELLTAAFDCANSNTIIREDLYGGKFNILEELCYQLYETKQFKLNIYYRKLQIELIDFLANLDKNIIMRVYANLVGIFIEEFQNFKDAKKFAHQLFSRHKLSIDQIYISKRFLFELTIQKNFNELADLLYEFDPECQFQDLYCVLWYRHGNYESASKTKLIYLELKEPIIEAIIKKANERHTRYLLRSKLKLGLDVKEEVTKLQEFESFLELALIQTDPIKQNKLLNKAKTTTSKDFDYEETVSLLSSSSLGTKSDFECPNLV